jgi:hypothetical protein
MKTALPLLIVLALLAGCSSVYDVRKAMDKGGYEQVLQDTRDITQFPERDSTLILNYRAQAKLGLGYYDSARRDYLQAWNVMNLSEGGGVGNALFLSERQKFWMGDPYERAYNSWYLGVLYYQLGDLVNCQPAFKNAVFVDSGDLEAGEYIADWLPAHIMRVRAFLARQDEDGARGVLEEVARLPDKAPNAEKGMPTNFDPGVREWLTVEAQKDANTVIMLELGQGPFFTAEGHHGSVRVTNQGDYHEASVEVIIDGQSMGRARKIGDTFYQAITRGGRVMDEILQGKAIAKTTSIAVGAGSMHVGRRLYESGNRTAGAIVGGVGAALLIAGLAGNAEADTRGNVLLPGETHLMMARLDEGAYTVDLKFYDRADRELPQLAQRGLPLTVPREGDAVLLARSAPRYEIPDDVRRMDDPYKAPVPEAGTASGN